MLKGFVGGLIGGALVIGALMAYAYVRRLQKRGGMPDNFGDLLPSGPSLPSSISGPSSAAGSVPALGGTIHAITEIPGAMGAP